MACACGCGGRVDGDRPGAPTRPELKRTSRRMTTFRDPTAHEGQDDDDDGDGDYKTQKTSETKEHKKEKKTKTKKIWGSSNLRADFKQLARHALTAGSSSADDGQQQQPVAGHEAHFSKHDPAWLRKETNLAEIDFYEHSTWPARYLPRYGGQFGGTGTTGKNTETAALSSKGVILEDVTVGFRRPCVMDVKMGTTTAGERDAAFKKLRLTITDALTGTRATGARVVGFSVYHPRNGDTFALSKRKAFAAAMRYDALSVLAFYLSDGRSLRADVVTDFRRLVADLADHFESQIDYRFVGSSLLFVYEGKKPPHRSSRRIFVERASRRLRGAVDRITSSRTSRRRAQSHRPASIPPSTTTTTTSLSTPTTTVARDTPPPPGARDTSTSAPTNNDDDDGNDDDGKDDEASADGSSSVASSGGLPRVAARSVAPPAVSPLKREKKRRHRSTLEFSGQQTEPKKPPTGCRLVMIDFAKTRRLEGDDRGVDEGYLTGLRTLKDHLDTLAAHVQVHGPRLASWPEATWEEDAAG